MGRSRGNYLRYVQYRKACCKRPKKNLLVPMKLKNGMYRLVKIPKGKIYRYYTEINRRGKITLCKEVFNKEWLRDVITMPREDFKKYFKEVKK